MSQLLADNNPRSRVLYLDGIRGLAILAVLEVHWLERFVHRGFLGGYIGVDVFFVLSGYIITSIIIRGSGLSYTDFFWRRVRRLYPPLLGLLVVGGILAALIPSAHISAAVASRNALISLLQLSSIWSAASNVRLDPFGVTWSLAVEWYFYLLWLAVLFGAKRRGIRPSGSWAVRVAALACVLYLAALSMSGRWFYFGPVARIPELLVGSAVALAVPSIKGRTSRQWELTWAIVIGSALLALAAWTVVGPNEFSFAYRTVGLPLAVLSTALVILVGLCWPTGIWARLLSTRQLAFVGRTSYSLYLWHTVPLVLFTVSAVRLPKPVVAFMDILFAVLLTSLSYVFLERGARHSEASSLLSRTSPSEERVGVLTGQAGS